jgi:hypothetical protein
MADAGALLGLIEAPMILGLASYGAWCGWKVVAATSRDFKLVYLAVIGLMTGALAAGLSYIAYCALAHASAG